VFGVFSEVGGDALSEGKWSLDEDVGDREGERSGRRGLSMSWRLFVGRIISIVNVL